MPNLSYHATVLASLLDAGFLDDTGFDLNELPPAAQAASRGEGHETTFDPRDESLAFAAVWGG